MARLDQHEADAIRNRSVHAVVFPGAAGSVAISAQ
jgi:hypothetical protein